MADDALEKLYFPFSQVRDSQKELVFSVEEALKNQKSMVIHAPTGLGKTAAILSPAIKHALDNNLTIFFLTPRHTQHMIALETIKLIKEKYDLKFSAIDLVGKRWFCSVPGIELLSSSEFSEYCKKQKEDNSCEYYVKTRKSNKLTMECKNCLHKLMLNNPNPSENIKEICSEEGLCAYEVTMELGKKSTVIIADYLHFFSPGVKANLLNKIEKDISKSIIVIDEGHNVPSRVREEMTQRLSNFMLKRAATEARNAGNEEIEEILNIIIKILDAYSKKTDNEILISKEKFVEDITQNTNMDYDQLIEDLMHIAKEVLEKKKMSYCALVSYFLSFWPGEDKGFVRFFSKTWSKRKEPINSLTYRCLDPSFITRPIIEESYSTIIMSGTLTPMKMYADLLGFKEDAKLERYASPFPEDNKLTLVVPKTTTKYSERTDEQFRNIAKICAEITNAVPGNSAIFFPSYYLRDMVYKTFMSLSSNTAFLENSELSKAEKQDLLERFKQYKDSGAVLLGVMTGSFGEGIDLPGDLLKCVVVVGLPLQKPTLEVDALIGYYDEKFGKGMDYGYIFPAMNKTLQSAGRCIRSETDKGAIIFLDERYTWDRYFRCFPIDWDVKTTLDYKEKIKEFFSK